MALKSSLRLISKRISQAVQRSAAKQGLTSADFILLGSYDPESEYISLTLGTDHAIDDRRWYADTLDEIRRAFPDFTSFTMHIGLVIRKVANLDDTYAYHGVSDNELDLAEMLQHS
jgi:hypothetical protein